MNKKYIVRLTDPERAAREATIKSQKGKSKKLRLALILLKADAAGPGRNDPKISMDSESRFGPTPASGGCRIFTTR